FAGEALYAWNGLQGSVVNGHRAVLSKNGWGGRLSGGVVYPYTQQFGLNAEFGGGYYGHINSNLAVEGVTSSTNIIGYDLLIGGTYHASLLDLYFNFGAMAQNMEYGITVDKGKRVPGGLVSGVNQSHLSQTQLLPEIKVGGVYTVAQNLGATLSYTHVFGHTVNSNSINDATSVPPAIFASGRAEQRNPSIDAILFGLRYNFA
ncbi:hypothetical protein N9Q05_00955, partial [bacterium]|nr:hypothetical protein [bacterium]